MYFSRDTLMKLAVLLLIAGAGYMFFTSQMENMEGDEKLMEEQIAEEVMDELEQEAADLPGLSSSDSEPASAPEFSGQDISASDLLPQSLEGNEFADRHPEGLGPLSDKNFLQSGFHVGINTVGTSLRNANVGIRSEPANPTGTQSPWNQTTITPDLNRKPLEIGCQ